MSTHECTSNRMRKIKPSEYLQDTLAGTVFMISVLIFRMMDRKVMTSKGLEWQTRWAVLRSILYPRRECTVALLKLKVERSLAHLIAGFHLL
jgi:hypothetical protein